MSKTAVLLSYPGLQDEAVREAGPRAPVDSSIPSGGTSPTVVSGRIEAAVIGPGNFAKETLIPLLRSSKEYHLRWVVSSNPTHATRVAKRYRFERSTCDYSEVLSDPTTSLVVITAPNNLHSSMLAEAMRARKMALVEKPLCVTRAEFETVKKAQAESGMPVIVGFNRRYAPLVRKVKERMSRLDGPFVINYRVNAGFVPASKWSQNPAVGGGRIIHECCHFFDLFNFLLGRSDPKIVVRSAGINGSTSVARDNLSITLEYADGSLATLLYVAMGNKAMDRERMEVFGEGTSMVIDDFKTLRVYGTRSEIVNLSHPDKGHASELAEVAKLLRGEPSSTISTQEAFSATELTFRVDEEARRAASSA